LFGLKLGAETEALTSQFSVSRTIILIASALKAVNCSFANCSASLWSHKSIVK
jgi:hypothetical protein